MSTPPIIQGKAFFSTHGGRYAPRQLEPGSQPPLIVRTDIHQARQQLIQDLRSLHSHVCFAIAPPWDIRDFWDQYDFQLLGGAFLWDTINVIVNENGQYLRDYIFSWSHKNQPNLHLLLHLGPQQLFDPSDVAKFGLVFLGRAYELMRAAFIRSMELEALATHRQIHIAASLPEPVGQSKPAKFSKKGIKPPRQDSFSISIGPQMNCPPMALQNPPMIFPTVTQQSTVHTSVGLTDKAPGSVPFPHVPIAGAQAFSQPDLLPKPDQDPRFHDPLQVTTVPASGLDFLHQLPLNAPIDLDQRRRLQASSGDLWAEAYKLGTTTNHPRKVSSGRGGRPRRGSAESTRASEGFSGDETVNVLQQGSRRSVEHWKVKRRSTIDKVRDQQRNLPAHIEHPELENAVKTQEDEPFAKSLEARQHAESQYSDKQLCNSVNQQPELDREFLVSDTYIGANVNHIQELYIRHAGHDSEQIISKAFEKLVPVKNVSITHPYQAKFGHQYPRVFIRFHNAAHTRKVLHMRFIPAEGTKTYEVLVPNRYFNEGGTASGKSEAFSLGAQNSRAHSRQASLQDRVEPKAVDITRRHKVMNTFERSKNDLYSPQDARSSLLPLTLDVLKPVVGTSANMENPKLEGVLEKTTNGWMPAEKIENNPKQPSSPEISENTELLTGASDLEARTSDPQPVERTASEASRQHLTIQRNRERGEKGQENVAPGTFVIDGAHKDGERATDLGKVHDHDFTRQGDGTTELENQPILEEQSAISCHNRDVDKREATLTLQKESEGTKTVTSVSPHDASRQTSSVTPLTSVNSPDVSPKDSRDKAEDKGLNEKPSQVIALRNDEADDTSKEKNGEAVVLNAPRQRTATKPNAAVRKLQPIIPALPRGPYPLKGPATAPIRPTNRAVERSSNRAKSDGSGEKSQEPNDGEKPTSAPTLESVQGHVLSAVESGDFEQSVHQKVDDEELATPRISNKSGTSPSVLLSVDDWRKAHTALGRAIEELQLDHPSRPSWVSEAEAFVNKLNDCEARIKKNEELTSSGTRTQRKRFKSKLNSELNQYRSLVEDLEMLLSRVQGAKHLRYGDLARPQSELSAQFPNHHNNDKAGKSSLQGYLVDFPSDEYFRKRDKNRLLVLTNPEFSERTFNGWNSISDHEEVPLGRRMSHPEGRIHNASGDIGAESDETTVSLGAYEIAGRSRSLTITHGKKKRRKTKHAAAIDSDDDSSGSLLIGEDGVTEENASKSNVTQRQGIIEASQGRRGHCAMMTGMSDEEDDVNHPGSKKKSSEGIAPPPNSPRLSSTSLILGNEVFEVNTNSSGTPWTRNEEGMITLRSLKMREDFIQEQERASTETTSTFSEDTKSEGTMGGPEATPRPPTAETLRPARPPSEQSTHKSSSPLASPKTRTYASVAGSGRRSAHPPQGPEQPTRPNVGKGAGIAEVGLGVDMGNWEQNTLLESAGNTTVKYTTSPPQERKGSRRAKGGRASGSSSSAAGHSGGRGGSGSGQRSLENCATKGLERGEARNSSGDWKVPPGQEWGAGERRKGG